MTADRADGKPRTGTRYIIQTRPRVKGEYIGPWDDVENIPRYQTLYAAIEAKEKASEKAHGSDPIVKILREIANEVDFGMDQRIVKRTITTVDEVVEESESILNPKA